MAIDGTEVKLTKIEMTGSKFLKNLFGVARDSTL